MTRELSQAQLDKDELYRDVIEILLPYMAKEMPKLGQRTPASMVDEVGKLKEMASDLEKVIKMMNDVIKSKLEPTEKEVRGDEFKVERVSFTQTRLSQEKVKLVLTGEQYAACCTDIDIEQMRYKRL